MIALVCIVTFTFAGGYSSRVVTATSDEVLVKTMNCGYKSPTFWTAQTAAANVAYSSRISNAATYAAQCYSNDANIQMSGCRELTSSRLPAKINYEASCPFHEKSMCISSSENLIIDSGLLDSHEHLGLNAPTDQRILWRNVLHCAPIVTEGFTSTYYSSHPTLNGSTLYHYGGYNVTSPKGFDYLGEYLFLAPPLSTQNDFQLSNDSRLTYARLDLQTSTTIIENRKPTPDSPILIDSLARQDADVHILFLSGNGVFFTQPSNDLWYRLIPKPMRGPVLALNDSLFVIDQYILREPASPLGCASQYQFCNSGTNECGPLASQLDAIAGAAPIFETTYEKFIADEAATETASRFTYFIKSSIMPNAPYIHDLLIHLGPTVLLSSRYQLNGFQYGLQDNQWQLDMSNMWASLMASYQFALLDAAAGPTDPDVLVDWVTFTTPEFRKLCKNQKFRSTSYASLSILGLALILSIGTLVIVVSYLLEPLSNFTHKKGRRQYQHLEWTTNSTLQLQRIAFEASGIHGAWSNCTRAVPTNAEDRLLGNLNISDPEHPVFCYN